MDNVQAYQTGKGHVRYRVDLAFTHEGIFHRYRQQGFETAKEAAQWARKRELLIRTGGTVEARTRQSSAPGDDPRGWTVDEVFNRLIEYWKTRHKASTIANNASKYRCRIQHRIGKKRWCELSQRDLDGIAGGHWRDAVTFSSMWKHAPRIGAVMPAARWNAPKRQINQRLIFLEPDEAKRAGELLPVEYRPIYWFAIGTGMRLGELLGLRWGDIDHKRRLIHVQRQLSPYGGITTPKSGKSRIIPLSRTAEKALDMLSPGLPDSPVFTVGRSAFGEAMHALQAPIGKAVTPHVLRHTFASWAVQAGVPLVVVARVLGHATTATTEVYAHLTPSHLQDGVSAVDAALA